MRVRTPHAGRRGQRGPLGPLVADATPATMPHPAAAGTRRQQVALAPASNVTTERAPRRARTGRARRARRRRSDDAIQIVAAMRCRALASSSTVAKRQPPRVSGISGQSSMPHGFAGTGTSRMSSGLPSRALSPASIIGRAARLSSPVRGGSAICGRSTAIIDRRMLEMLVTARAGRSQVPGW
jgi:hypothetical protein